MFSTPPGLCPRPLALRLIAAGLIVFAAACSDSQNPENPIGPEASPPGTDPKADVGATFDAIPAWEAISPPVAASVDTKLGDQTAGGSFLADTDSRYNPAAVCIATPHSLAKNPAEIVTLSANRELLVPGVLVQGRGHVLGSLSELVIDERAGIDLVIDEAATLVPVRTVDTPNRGSLQTGVNSLIQDAETSGFEGSSSVAFEQVTSYSAQQAALALDFSARYLGGEADGSLRSRTSGSETTVTASFVQRAFTISAVGPQFGEDWFTDEFTQARLDQYVSRGLIGPDNPPLYVQSVTYGRIVMVNFSAAESEEDIQGFFTAGYENGVGSIEGRISARQEEILRSATIEVVSIGGPAESGFSFAKEILAPNEEGSVGLDGFFARDVPLTAFVPISYVLADLRTGQVAAVGEVTEHEVLECSGQAESSFEGGAEGWSPVDEERDRFPGWNFHMSSANGGRTGSG
jgi:hypothetical protein